MTPEERVDHAADLAERPGLAIAFERGARPERLVVINDGGPAQTAKEPLAAVLEILNGEAHRIGWALVGLDEDYWREEDVPALTGHVLLATFEPLGARPRRGGQPGRPQRLPDTVVSDILIARWQGKSLQAIANDLTERNVSTAQGGTWRKATVAAVLRSQAAERLAREAEKLELRPGNAAP